MDPITPPTIAHTFRTQDQWLRHIAALVAEEYQCSESEAEYTARSRVGEWMDEHRDAIKAGAIPPQWWINGVLGRNAYGEPTYGWWECFLKHNPDVVERLAKAGRSLYRPKKDLWGPA